MAPQQNSPSLAIDPTISTDSEVKKIFNFVNGSFVKFLWKNGL